MLDFQGVCGARRQAIIITCRVENHIPADSVTRGKPAGHLSPVGDGPVARQACLPAPAHQERLPVSNKMHGHGFAILIVTSACISIAGAQSSGGRSSDLPRCCRCPRNAEHLVPNSKRVIEFRILVADLRFRSQVKGYAKARAGASENLRGHRS